MADKIIIEGIPWSDIATGRRLKWSEHSKRILMQWASRLQLGARKHPAPAELHRILLDLGWPVDQLDHNQRDKLIPKVLSFYANRFRKDNFPPQDASGIARWPRWTEQWLLPDWDGQTQEPADADWSRRSPPKDNKPYLGSRKALDDYQEYFSTLTTGKLSDPPGTEDNEYLRQQARQLRSLRKDADQLPARAIPESYSSTVKQVHGRRVEKSTTEPQKTEPAAGVISPAAALHDEMMARNESGDVRRALSRDLPTPRTSMSDSVMKPLVVQAPETRSSRGEDLQLRTVVPDRRSTGLATPESSAATGRIERVTAQVRKDKSKAGITLSEGFEGHHEAKSIKTGTPRPMYSSPSPTREVRHGKQHEKARHMSDPPDMASASFSNRMPPPIHSAVDVSELERLRTENAELHQKVARLSSVMMHSSTMLKRILEERLHLTVE